MQIACVLKRGPEYRPRHLYALVDTIRRHNPGAQVRCLTDDAVNRPDIEAVPLLHRWPGWWSKLELFRPDLLNGPTLYLDLDTVVVGRIDVVFDRFRMLSDVYRAGDFGSGCMAWSVPPVKIYETFARSPERYIDEYRTRAKWGDQAFIRDYLGQTPAVLDDQFRSYKAHCRRSVPHGTSVVYFHGKPRPWQVTLKVDHRHG